eukprot:TRINITY_DN4287_c0_g2_i1.p1 TRINITY_DN4287_c0_g2~~TRINITY_DN4287_c0_g2_i1.p1  ORF type:complete len:308 (+),score=57.10 TRINITY_DN4287_c0_g2_i1:25-948(+)
MTLLLHSPPLRPRRRNSSTRGRCFSRTLAACALTSAAALLACQATITRGFVPAASSAIDKSAASRRELLSGLSILGISQVADSRSALAKSMKIEVVIDKTKDSSLGVLFDDSPEAQKDEALIIRAVKPDGLLQQWNNQNPDKAIEEGDKLIGANKATQKIQIVNECKGQKKLNLVFRRELGEKPVPDDIRIAGYEGKKELNGRWSIALFGKKVNGKPVYKRAGEDIYLIFNQCGEFQMSTDATGECTGFGVKTQEGWKIDGVLMPSVKMRAYKDEGPDPYKPTDGYDKFIYDEGRADPRNRYLYDNL